jgi:putative flippase GtrA
MTQTIASPARPVAPGAFGAFARFVLFGGGVGLASSVAVPLVATFMPWAAANALITVASTVLGTELHARFTFGAGRRAQWRQHLQSAGSAVAAYLVTSAAILVLHVVQPSAGMRWEQAVYLSASGLAGTGRFLVLRLYVFARDASEPSRVGARRAFVCGQRDKRPELVQRGPRTRGRNRQELWFRHRPDVEQRHRVPRRRRLREVGDQRIEVGVEDHVPQVRDVFDRDGGRPVIARLACPVPGPRRGGGAVCPVAPARVPQLRHRILPAAVRLSPTVNETPAAR